MSRIRSATAFISRHGDSYDGFGRASGFVRTNIFARNFILDTRSALLGGRTGRFNALGLDPSLELLSQLLNVPLSKSRTTGTKDFGRPNTRDGSPSRFSYGKGLIPKRDGIIRECARVFGRLPWLAGRL